MKRVETKIKSLKKNDKIYQVLFCGESQQIAISFSENDIRCIELVELRIVKEGNTSQVRAESLCKE